MNSISIVIISVATATYFLFIIEPYKITKNTYLQESISFL